LSRRSVRARTIQAILAAGLAGLAVGLFAAISSPAPAQLYGRLTYHVRDALGLQKNWFTLPGPAQAQGRDARGCPSPEEALVLVIGGQSNASNVVPVLHQVEGDVSVWFDGRCFPADDPTLGATANGGSLWSVLGDQLANRLDRPVLLIVGSVGGTQFGDWLDHRSGYYEALLQRVTTAYAAGYQPNMILWHQGETDAAAERDMARLEQTAGALVDRLLADIPDTPLYLFQASRCTGTYRVDGVREVVEVLRAVAAARPRVITGMDTDTLGPDYRWDTCHFNSIARAQIVADILPDLVARLKITP
jgi:hypothetical protein